MSQPGEEGPVSVAALHGAEQTPSLRGGEAKQVSGAQSVNIGQAEMVDGADEGGRGRAQRGPTAPAALPCLSSNNSTGGEGPQLNTHARKTAFALIGNLRMMVERHSLERIVFGTLGFTNPAPGDKRPDPNWDFREAGRRLNSLRSHVLKDVFSEMIIVPERGAKSGRLHFHLVGAQEHDVRTGVDFAAIAARDYRSVPEALRELWKLFRDEKTGGKGTASAYGFGRTEWLPVKSTTEGIARYVGKYIAKQFAGRRPEDKGMRLVRYTQGTNCWRARFSWNSPRAKLWRWQVGRFAAKFGCRDLDALAEKFGPRWAYKKQEEIMGQPDIPTHPALLQVWFEDQVAMQRAAELAGAPKQEIGSWIIERGKRAAERLAFGPVLVRPPSECPEGDAEELDKTTIWADGSIEHEHAPTLFGENE